MGRALEYSYNVLTMDWGYNWKYRSYPEDIILIRLLVITYRGSFQVITPLATTVCSDCRCGVMYMCVNLRELSMWADAHTLSIHKSKARKEASLCNESSKLPLALEGYRGVGVWEWGYVYEGVRVWVWGCEGVGVWLPPEECRGWPLPNPLDSFILRSSYTQSQFFLLTLFQLLPATFLRW